ncbi:MAG: hypothetical protein COB54_06730 [Alphaproteobacteria bacterium]|nr:MAG: hypothetical protein COB54_06730 [Alphaproteobacteria bacterium]
MNRQCSQYYLPKHVYICMADKTLVFLDLKRDKYLCLDESQSKSVWSYCQSPCEEQEGEGISENLLKLLLQNNLFTKNDSQRKDIPAVIGKTATGEVRGYDVGSRPKINIKHIFHFLRAYLISILRLRFYPLQKITRKIKKHKHQNRQQKTAFEKIPELIEIFKTIRPLLFSTRNNCMLDALVLMEFLNSFGVFPTWVFGVRMGPFLAHCWLQSEKIILNDTLDHVAPFTPILAI